MKAILPKLSTARILLLSVLCAVGNMALTHAQEARFGLPLQLKARGSFLFHHNNLESSFSPTRSQAIGLQLNTFKNINRWQLEGGIGLERMAFRQISRNHRHSAVYEELSIGFIYHSFQVPLTLHYALSEPLSVFAGITLMLIDLNAYQVGVSSMGTGASGFETIPVDEFPGMQLTAEMHSGLQYRLSPRIALGVHAAVALNRLEAMDITFKSDQAKANVERFSYRWLRCGLDLTYRLR